MFGFYLCTLLCSCILLAAAAIIVTRYYTAGKTYIRIYIMYAREKRNRNTKWETRLTLIYFLFLLLVLMFVHGSNIFIVRCSTSNAYNIEVRLKRALQRTYFVYTRNTFLLYGVIFKLVVARRSLF